MCGIAGIINFSSKSIVEESIISMLSSIYHRGPDESGIYLGNGIGLGNVRLSIIDLKTGQQPMLDDSGDFVIVYNGEIYNYPELRETLIKKGYTFRTKSDTEVVLKMFIEYGSECLNYFNGQFALAIWNKKKRELFLARDRVGIRPLFYTQVNGGLSFCSEIKGLFELPFIERKFSAKSILQTFTFWAPISPATPFENIFELPPGHFMIVNDTVRIQKYWDYDFSNQIAKNDISIKQATDEFYNLLLDSVRLRLRADVKVAAYLSGGIDSTATTYLIKQIFPENVDTYSIGFSDRDFDESDYQNEASAYLKTNHIGITCNLHDIAESLVDTIWYGEYPVLRTAPAPLYLLSKKVRHDKIKVVITGEGADEMLAGYNIFKESKIRRFWAKEPASKLRPLLLTKLYPYLPAIKNSNVNMLRLFFGYKLDDTKNPLYSHLLRWHNTSRINTYLSNDFTGSAGSLKPLEDVTAILPNGFYEWSHLAQAQYIESKIFMSGYLLSSQGDRMAMGNSVEGRYPFLDHRLVEFASKLPDDFKLNGLTEKYILKKAVAGKIPDSIVSRSKQAYRAPVSLKLLKESEQFNHFLSPAGIKESGVFDNSKIEKLIKKLDTGKTISEVDNMALVAIFSTRIIEELFINKKPSAYKSHKLDNLKTIIKDY